MGLSLNNARISTLRAGEGSVRVNKVISSKLILAPAGIGRVRSDK